MSDIHEPPDIEPLRRREDGWSVWPTRDLDDGRTLALEPLLTGMRIHVVRDRRDSASTSIYDFTDHVVAMKAFIQWDGEGDPVGWYRHRPSNRRRPDGDPTKEYVAR